MCLAPCRAWHSARETTGRRLRASAASWNFVEHVKLERLCFTAAGFGLHAEDIRFWAASAEALPQA